MSFYDTWIFAKMLSKAWYYVMIMVSGHLNSSFIACACLSLCWFFSKVLGSLVCKYFTSNLFIFWLCLCHFQYIKFLMVCFQLRQINQSFTISGVFSVSNFMMELLIVHLLCMIHYSRPWGIAINKQKRLKSSYLWDSYSNIDEMPRNLACVSSQPVEQLVCYVLFCCSFKRQWIMLSEDLSGILGDNQCCRKNESRVGG